MTTQTMAIIFRDNLRRALKRHKRAQVARKSGYSESHIRRILRGEQSPTLTFVDAMEGTLGVHLLYR